MGNAINSGDTDWMLVSCALVLMMTPGLAFFYGGMVRRKNILSTLTLSYVFMALIGVQWLVFGYSLSFGPDIAGIIGGLDFVGFKGVGTAPSPNYGPTIPHQLFASYQMMFAVITPALITGAFVERVRFKTFLLFSLAWATLVYDPLCHWVWAKGGWLAEKGVLDFAGGTVVHIAAGFLALAFALAIGPRRGFPKTPMEPHNIPFTVLGTGLLWVGWFGFNAGSALAANGVAVNALLTTNTSTSVASAALVWMVLSWLDGRPSTLGLATGMVVGLAAVTPASGFVTPMAALFIGACAAPLSYYAIRYRQRRDLDESLDVWACHGMASTWGTLAAGLFATVGVNSAGANGLFYGNPGQLWTQLVAVVSTMAYSFVVTYILAKLLDLSIGLKVTTREEEVGLDISAHGERAYSWAAGRQAPATGTKIAKAPGQGARNMLRKIEAIIREDKLNDVKEALRAIGIMGMNVCDVRGHGRQGGIVLSGRSGTYQVDLLPKIQLNIVLSEQNVDETVQAIVKSARSGTDGEAGDGLIFILPIEEVVRIRTGERGHEAVMYPGDIDERKGLGRSNS